MAVTLAPPRQVLRRPANPLRVSGTALPESWLAVAKGIAFLLVALGYAGKLGEPHLPIVRAIDQAPGALFGLGIRAAAVLGLALLFTNLAVRVGSLLVGSAFLLGMLANQTTYRNSVVWSALILILIGLYEDERSERLLQAQFVLLYSGAFLSKIFDADWRDGTFIDNWRFDQSAVYDHAAEVVAVAAFPVVIAWTVIVFEGLLAVLYLRPRLRNWAVGLSLGFHSIPLVMNDLTFGIFYPALAISNLALFDLRSERPIDPRRLWRQPAAYVILAIAYGVARAAKNAVLA